MFTRLIFWGSCLIITGIIMVLFFNYHKLEPDYGAKLMPPTGLRAEVEKGIIKLSWRATVSTAEAEYQIFMSGDGRGFSRIGATRATNYTVTNLAHWKKYFFKITASLNQVATSDFSETIEVYCK